MFKGTRGLKVGLEMTDVDTASACKTPRDAVREGCWRRSSAAVAAVCSEDAPRLSLSVVPFPAGDQQRQRARARPALPTERTQTLLPRPTQTSPQNLAGSHCDTARKPSYALSDCAAPCRHVCARKKTFRSAHQLPGA